MVWVIKNKLGEYWRDYTWDAKPVAMHFRSIAAAHASLAEWTSNEAFESNKPRIVRLKPRAARCTHPPGCEQCNWCGYKSEALIRRAERERIAAAVEEQGILICLAHKPVGQIAHLDNCTSGTRGAQALKSAILALDWKPGT